MKRAIITLLSGLLSLTSCVQGDLFDEFYDDIDSDFVISRNKRAKETGSSYYINDASVPYFTVAGTVFGSSGCGLNCIVETTGLKRKYIRGLMEGLNGFEEGTINASDIPTVIDLINEDKNCQAYDCTFKCTSELQTGDIAITNAPLTLETVINNSVVSKTSECGHAFVVDEIVTNKGRKSFRDDDDYLYCDFDEYYIQGGYRITKNSN